MSESKNNKQRKRNNTRRNRRKRQNKRNGNGNGKRVRPLRAEDIAEHRDRMEAYHEMTQEIASSLRYDPRAVANLDLDLYIENANPEIPFTVPTEPDTFLGPIMAIASYAWQRGWLLIADTDSDPYFAVMYTWKFLVDAAQNKDPELSTVPTWLHLMYQAVIQKVVKSGSGKLAYNFDIQGTIVESSQWLIGPANSDTYWICDPKGGVVVNSLFYLSTPPSAYDNNEGERAAQQMWNFLAAKFPNHPMHAKVSTISTNTMTNDATAFSVINTAPGGGFGKVGGWNQLIQLEIPVWSPIFGCFKSSLPKGDNSRASKFALNFSGDGLQLGGLLVAELQKEQIHLKQPPQVKFIDFLEFGNVLALFVCKVIELRTSTQEFVELYAENSNYYAEHVQCPITLQEMLLLLRAVMCEAFAESQYKYQALHPRTVENNEKEFITFSAGINCCAQVGTTQMKLPSVIKHNILALTGRTIFSGRGGKKNPYMWNPALGKFKDEELKEEDYKVELGEESEECCFFVNPNEVDIQLTDGKTGRAWAYINDPAALQPLSEKWNFWCAENLDFMWPPEAIGTDPGIDAIWSLGMTMHWRNQQRTAGTLRKPRAITPKEVAVRKSQTSKIAKNDPRFATPELRNSLYEHREALAVSCVVQPFQTAWETLVQYFIFPQNVIGPPDNEQSSFTGYTRISAFRGENIQLPVGEGSTGFMTFQQRHENMANMCIKTKFAIKDNVHEFITDMDEKGYGGILSSLAAALAGSLAPEIAPVANAIASVVPF